MSSPLRELSSAGHDRPLVCLLRSPSDPDPYEAAFEAAGFRVQNVPVLRFVFVNEAALQDALAASDGYAGLVLTSPRSAEALARVFETTSLLTAWRDKPAFVVGPRTADAVRSLGLTPRGEDSGSAEALADAITECSYAAPLLFLCSNRRRDVLPARLHAADVPFVECCVYETHLREDLPLDDLAPSWLVFFSPSGVEAVRRADVDLSTVEVAAIGPTTAKALTASGVAVAVVAEAPTPQALVAAIVSVERA